MNCDVNDFAITYTGTGCLHYPLHASLAGFIMRQRGPQSFSNIMAPHDANTVGFEALMQTAFGGSNPSAQDMWSLDYLHWVGAYMLSQAGGGSVTRPDFLSFRASSGLLTDFNGQSSTSVTLEALRDTSLQSFDISSADLTSPLVHLGSRVRQLGLSGVGQKLGAGLAVDSII